MRLSLSEAQQSPNFLLELTGKLTVTLDALSEGSQLRGFRVVDS